MRMHADEVLVDAELVGRLVADRFPRWAGLPVTPVTSSGTDNAMFRLGDELAVRLPRMPGAANGVLGEARWIPALAPHLPVTVPAPLAVGEPAQGYPFSWSVCPWLAGANPVAGDTVDGLADFIAALRRVDPAGAPAAGRGVPLAERDADTRAALAASVDLVDTVALTAIWDDALRLPAWDGPATWLHGDLSPGNILVRDGVLTAVIDWSCAGIGDPTVDLYIAWNLLPPGARTELRAALEVDEVTWLRGRAWALSIAIIQLPYYQHTNPALAASSRHVLAAVLAD